MPNWSCFEFVERIQALIYLFLIFGCGKTMVSKSPLAGSQYPRVNPPFLWGSDISQEEKKYIFQQILTIKFICSRLYVNSMIMGNLWTNEVSQLGANQDGINLCIIFVFVQSKNNFWSAYGVKISGSTQNFPLCSYFQDCKQYALKERMTFGKIDFYKAYNLKKSRVEYR